MAHIAVIGAGAWGTALAVSFAKQAHRVMLWAHNPEVAESLSSRRENAKYLPGVALSAGISVTPHLPAVKEAEALVLVVPAQHMREVARQLAVLTLCPGAALIICAKGVEQGSLLLMSEVIEETLPGHPVLVLSGPNFAAEVAKGLPAATTLACGDIAVAKSLSESLSSPSFRMYYSEDVVGAQVAGAVKNVLAIACGITIGKQLGENAKAALITRGLAEMRRLCIAKGGREETLLGLSGIGDVMLTCSSAKSRNTSLGIALGEGQVLEEILARRSSVTEGVMSAESVTALAERLKVDMPICRAVYRILYEKVSVSSAIEGLLQRPLTGEL